MNAERQTSRRAWDAGVVRPSARPEIPVGIHTLLLPHRWQSRPTDEDPSSRHPWEFRNECGRGQEYGAQLTADSAGSETRAKR